jgi:hypothetical protein
MEKKTFSHKKQQDSEKNPSHNVSTRSSPLEFTHSSLSETLLVNVDAPSVEMDNSAGRKAEGSPPFVDRHCFGDSGPPYFSD